MVIGRVAAQSAGIPSARVIPFNLTPIIELGTSDGFEYQLKDLQGRPPRRCPPAMATNGPAPPYKEKDGGGKTPIVLGLAVLFRGLIDLSQVSGGSPR